MSGECVFCRIIAGELPCKKEYEDSNVMAFDDINPIAPVHVLIVPKKHIENLSKAEDEDKIVLGDCQLVAAKLASKLGIKEAFRVATASGKKAGQSVFHLHYHLIGGWNEEKTHQF